MDRRGAGEKGGANVSDGSAIEWTNATWNPVRGCTKVSPGCKHCYAETFAERWRGTKGHPYEQGFDLRLVPNALTKPFGWRAPRKIFVNSMSDLFHEDVSDEYIAAVFGVMAATPRHTYQVLTKRAERMREWFDWAARGPDGRHGHQAQIRCSRAAVAAGLSPNDVGYDTVNGTSRWAWPLPNVWLGVSVENQAYADERIPHLLATPAAVRFLSVEPLLGPVDLHAIQIPGERNGLRFSALTRQHDARYGSSDSLLHWVIVGGESGAGAREMRREWVAYLRNQCVESDVSFFFKQWGGVRKKIAGRVLDGRTWDEYPEART